MMPAHNYSTIIQQIASDPTFCPFVPGMVERALHTELIDAGLYQPGVNIFETSNTHRRRLFQNFTPSLQDKLSKMHVYGLSAFISDPLRLQASVHLPGEVSAAQTHDAVVDCSQRVVLQRPFASRDIHQVYQHNQNLIQATVVSPCFLDQDRQRPLHRPGGVLFLNRFCLKNANGTLRLDSHNKYTFDQNQSVAFKQYIKDTARLYFAALKDQHVTLTTIPDVGCGAYLGGLKQQSKTEVKQLIHSAWYEAACEALNNPITSLTTVLFTYPDSSGQPSIYRPHPNKSIVYAPKKDNCILAYRLLQQNPDEIVAMATAGAVQGLFGECSENHLGSQEEGACYMPGNFSLAVMQDRRQSVLQEMELYALEPLPNMSGLNSQQVANPLYGLSLLGADGLQVRRLVNPIFPVRQAINITPPAPVIRIEIAPTLPSHLQAIIRPELNEDNAALLALKQQFPAFSALNIKNSRSNNPDEIVCELKFVDEKVLQNCQRCWDFMEQSRPMTTPHYFLKKYPSTITYIGSANHLNEYLALVTRTPVPVAPQALVAPPAPVIPQIPAHPNTMQPGIGIHSFFPTPSATTPQVPSASNLTPTQQEQINRLIEILTKEIKSFWPYPNKKLKQHKVDALIHLSTTAQTMSIHEAVKDTLEKYKKTILSGCLSHRTKDLFVSLQTNSNQPVKGPYL